MIHHGLTYQEYEALPGWRWSTIKLLHDHSPRAVKHAVDNPRPDTTSSNWLRAVHSLTLEPDRFDKSFSVYAGRRAGKLYDAHVICHPNTAVLNAREYATAIETAGAILAHPLVKTLFDGGEPEVCVTWTDDETGLQCKARIDMLSLWLVELKTMGTVHERQVASMVARSLWHGQVAHYAAGLAANDYEPAGVYIIAAEGKGAQDVAVFRLDDAGPDGALFVGAQLRARLMRKLADCVVADEWPGRHERDAQELVLPNYALEEPDLTFESGDLDE